MSFKKKPNGDKCLKCLSSNHSQCVAWTCMCTFCVSTVKKQREKTIRLEEYWKNRNKANSTMEFNTETSDQGQVNSGRIKPKDSGTKPKHAPKNTFKPWDDFYDEYLV